MTNQISSFAKASADKQNPNEKIEEVFEVETREGIKYQAKAIILATGTERRKLNVPGEVEYTSMGIHYCATCEKLDYQGKICGVVGGANSAVQAAVEVAQAAAHVYIIYRGTQLRGDPIWLDQVDKNPKIEIILNAQVSEIIGDGEKVTGVRLKSTSDGDLQVSRRVMQSGSSGNFQAGPATRVSQDSLQVHRDTAKLTDSALSRSDGEYSSWDPSLVSPATYSQNLSRKLDGDILALDKLFIEIGGVPGTALVIPLGVRMDAGGFIKVDEKMATNVEGIFAAGDLVSYGLSIEQISSAVGLGARAAASAFAYLKQEKAPSVWGSVQIKR